MAQVQHHPEFADQFRQLAQRAETSAPFMELFGEISALLRALEDCGHSIEGDHPDDASHPIYSSKFQTFALRRTPPTNYTPYAIDPPVVRIPYVWLDVAGGSEVAVVIFLGDKTKSGHDWYPPSWPG